jgi:hypothetical protein
MAKTSASRARSRVLASEDASIKKYVLKIEIIVCNTPVRKIDTLQKWLLSGKFAPQNGFTRFSRCRMFCVSNFPYAAFML